MREELIKHTTQINGTMLETALRPQIPLEPSIYKYFLKGERIAKERIYQLMTTPPALEPSEK